MKISRTIVTTSQTLALLSLVSTTACGDTGGRAGEESSTGASTGIIPVDTGPDEERATDAPIPASVLVQVEDEEGRPIAGAKVIMQAPGTSEPTPVPVLPGTPRSRGPLVVLTNSEGFALLQGLGSGVFSFEVRQNGYSSAVARVTLGPDSAQSRRVQLQATRAASFLAEDGLAELVHRNATIEIAPNSLVYGPGQREEPDPNNPGQSIVRELTGQPVTGEVQAELAVVDPRTADPAAIPAPLLGTNEAGSDGSTLISAGMIEFRMSQGGIPIEPAPGANVKVSFAADELDPRIAEAVAEGRTIPKWYLDTARGLWIEEGVWLPEPGPDGGVVLTALQPHFTWLNIDVPGTPYCHRLRVLDAEGNPMAGQDVVGSWHSVETTDDGIVCMEAPGDIPINVCGQNIKVAYDGKQIVSACTEGTGNWGLNGLGGYPPFKGPYDDANCPIVDVYCDVEAAICNPNESRYCGKDDPIKEVGICQNSKQYCVDGTHWSACADKVESVGKELCGVDPALDDNCNGDVDDGCFMCTEGAMHACYTGSLDELDKQKYPEASCAAGTQVCAKMGFWEECKGYIRGESEDCSTLDVDENCDGVSTCFGDAAWASAAEEDPIPMHGDAVAVDPLGTFVVAGINADSGGAPTLPVLCDKGKAPKNITSLDSDGLLVKYASKDGSCASVRRVGGPGVSKITDVKVVYEDKVTEVIVVGEFTGTLEEDEEKSGMCGEIDGEKDTRHLFIAAYDANLHCLWRRKLTEGIDGEAFSATLALTSIHGPAFIAARYTGQISIVKPAMELAKIANFDGLVMEVVIDDPMKYGQTAFRTIGSATALGDQSPEDIALYGNTLAVAGSFTTQLEQSKGNMVGREWFVRRYPLENGHLPVNPPTDFYAIGVPGDQVAQSVAVTAGDQLVVAGWTGTTATGIANCDTGTPVSGFIAYDLSDVGTIQSAACARLHGPNDERIWDFSLFEAGAPNVVASATTGGMVPAPVQVDVVVAGIPVVQKCGDQDDYLLGPKGLMDALAFRVEFGAMAGCHWLQRMPEHLEGTNPPPLGVSDQGSMQSAARIASSPAGDSFLTGWYEKGIGFAATGKPINLEGAAQSQAFVASVYP